MLADRDRRRLVDRAHMNDAHHCSCAAQMTTREMQTLWSDALLAFLHAKQAYSEAASVDYRELAISNFLMLGHAIYGTAMLTRRRRLFPVVLSRLVRQR